MSKGFFKTSLAERLADAALPLKPAHIKRNLAAISLIVTALVTYAFFHTIENPSSKALFITVSAAGILVGVLVVLYVVILSLIDLRIYKRTKSVEEVLPDFLQLTATNVRAGMTIDRALWLAIRPRFGILAKEIETVAKEVMSGSELTESLKRFADKYESDILKRSMSLLIEGINAGSEIGELLNRTSQNIQEVRTIQKEMAASVTSYSIFITFAAIVAAPILMALSKQLIIIVSRVSSNIGPMPQQGAVIALNAVGISAGDFRVFALIAITITALCSSFIIAIINKGNVKEGINYVPGFVIVALVLYFLAEKILGSVLTGFF
ncbi:MAG TPA: type II secretion system F family protein [Candidatus Binatia bacterium]|nr:type II secretion system F family protein [Candidatus Binatia bacterium]